MSTPNKILASVIALFAFISWAIAEIGYRGGLQFEASGLGFYGVLIVFPFILAGLIPYLLPVIQISECWMKKDPWKSLVVTGVLVCCHVFVGKIPFRNNLDGIAKRLTLENLETYISAAKEAENLGDFPSAEDLKLVFEKFPKLAGTGPEPPRFMSEPNDFVDVFWGGGLVGHRGARVYVGEGTPIPPSDLLHDGEYVSKFVQVHPMVWAFVSD